MLTRCPACATHFRVTADQLKARSGRVRCGQCQEVFNALDSLIEEPPAMVAPPPAEAPQASLPPPTEPAPEAPDEAPPWQPELPPILEPASAAEFEATEPEAAEPEPDAAEPEAVDPISAADAGDGAVADWSETFPAPPVPPRRWPWVIASLVALAAIGLQAVFAFRVELVVLMPEIRPTLVALCDVAGCEVGLPAKVSLVGIEASDLHPDSEHAGRLALTATLKNRAPFSQQFPHLELTLTDTADKAIARKVFAPQDYLPPKTNFAQGMQTNADITLAVGIDPGDLAASGYRLYLFYP